MCPVLHLCVQYAKPLAVFWNQILLLPSCSCIHFQVLFYFTWLYLFYTEGAFACNIITFVRFIHCYRSWSINSHIATSAEVDQKLQQSVQFLLLTIQLAWIFNLKQEMPQIHYNNSTSFVNNSKPKARPIQQGPILLGLPLSIIHTTIINYHKLQQLIT